MKCGLRFKALAGALLFIGLVVILLVLEDKCETYDPVGYVQASIPWFQDRKLPHSGPVGGEVADKILVVPALEEDDISWVTDELKEYISRPEKQKIYANSFLAGSMPYTQSTHQPTRPKPANSSHQSIKATKQWPISPT